MAATNVWAVAFQFTGDYDSEFDPPVTLFEACRLPNDLKEAEVLGQP
ncbi:hypothetical protein [Terrihabitans rhizophilus]|uniref:Uncharacterized protein n=1 Tax=Terrihabitans rhizophilus TaxID=3092662 RepID=A0ABU4RTC4_9HYPH|nr:hypothetical protein [Terrihabitans sp. PJ23]MDX6806935.1 hypothetical protein [Terrihabitans sp. PJ23]